MKRGIILLVLIVFSLAVFAQDEVSTGFDLEKSLTWLRNQSAAPLNVEELSMSILALHNNVNDLANRLIEEKDSTGCFPKGRCTAKETALATYALYSLGLPVDDSVNWLKENKIPWRGRGEWRIQIETPDLAQPGQCQVSYKIGEQASAPATFTISGNNIGKGASANPNAYSINVATDLSAAILSKPSSVITVDCTSLMQGVIISLIYKDGNNIFILKDDISTITELTIANSCYGRGACSYEDTLYVAWVLSEMGQNLDDLGVNTYLEVEASNNPLHKAILTRFNQKRNYLEEIKAAQAADGSWGGRSAYITAFNVYSLSKASEYSDVAMKGQEFLQRVARPDDGSWNRNVKDTAMVLIALQGGVQASYAVPSLTPDGELPVENGGVETVCDDLIDNDQDRFIDCGDGDCETFEGCIQETQTTTTEDCVNGVDDDGDGLADCDDPDCSLECGSTTEEPTFDSGTTVEEPVATEETSYAWIVWLIIIILILGGGGFFYFAYVKTGKIKLGKSKKSGMSFEDFKQKMEIKPQIPVKPVQRPMIQRAPQTAKPMRSAEDDALEKSLREAEKLLKGEK